MFAKPRNFSNIANMLPGDIAALWFQRGKRKYENSSITNQETFLLSLKAQNSEFWLKGASFFLCVRESAPAYSYSHLEVIVNIHHCFSNTIFCI